MKDIIKEIKRISKHFGVEPHQLTPVQFFSIAETTEWDVRKLGGFKKVLDSLFPVTIKAEQSLVDQLRKPKKLILKSEDFIDAVVIGDMHLIWPDADVVNRIMDDIARKPPKFVIQMGDLYDFYNFSKYKKSRNLVMPKTELVTGKAMADKFWNNVKDAAPKAKKYQLIGNHDERVIKMIYEKFPEIESLFDPNSLFKFDSVHTMESESDELIINDTMFIHGYLSKPGDHAKKNGMNVVCAHSHRPGLEVMHYNGRTIYEVNAGYVSNPLAPCFKYGQQKRKNWARSYVRMDEHGPRVIIMEKK